MSKVTEFREMLLNSVRHILQNYFVEFCWKKSFIKFQRVIFEEIMDTLMTTQYVKKIILLVINNLVWLRPTWLLSWRFLQRTLTRQRRKSFLSSNTFNHDDYWFEKVSLNEIHAFKEMCKLFKEDQCDSTKFKIGKNAIFIFCSGK